MPIREDDDGAGDERAVDSEAVLDRVVDREQVLHRGKACWLGRRRLALLALTEYRQREDKQSEQQRDTDEEQMLQQPARATRVHGEVAEHQ